MRQPSDRILRGPALPLVGALLAWLGCYLPWVATKGAALSSNLYDLAEWMSLNPVVRAANPPLLATFLLRIAPGLIAVFLSIAAAALSARPARLLIRTLALLIGIGLLPPFDFFRGQFGDPNYRQQFLIAVLTCAGVILAWWKPGRRFGWALITVALISASIGEALSLNVLAALGLHVSIGIGAFVTSIMLVGVLILCAEVSPLREQRGEVVR